MDITTYRRYLDNTAAPQLVRLAVDADRQIRDLRATIARVAGTATVDVLAMRVDELAFAEGRLAMYEGLSSRMESEGVTMEALVEWVQLREEDFAKSDTRSAAFKRGAKEARSELINNLL